jgi:hypothetical protein
MEHREVSPTASAARQRRYRARARRGEAVLRVRANYFDLINGLVESTILSEGEALDRAKVETAVAEVLQTWLRQRRTFP